jgi:L-cysteine S-thiosulfotransferase
MSTLSAACRRGLAALGCAWALAAAQAPAADAALGSSGFGTMGPELQAMQRDDSLNPGMLWVKDGEALWHHVEQRDAGQARRSCASCHGQASTSMRGVATRYPAIDVQLQQPLDLAGRINLCRTRHQLAAAWAPEAAPLLALQAWVALQSRGLALAPPADPALAPYRERGAALFAQRIGQLDLSCANCHDALVGKRLGGNPVPPGDPAPYPAYRLQWQNLGSLQRRIRNCMTGVRAEPFAYGSVEMIELSLHLAMRARGLALEAPGVRP